jgi:hypothetical protein
MASWIPDSPPTPSASKGSSATRRCLRFQRYGPGNEGAETVVIGDRDHAAPYGVLSEIEALGLDLVEIQQLTPDRNTAESEDRNPPR